LNSYLYIDKTIASHVLFQFQLFIVAVLLVISWISYTLNGFCVGEIYKYHL